MLLGGHSRLVGLGEIASVLRPGPRGLEKTRQVLCSCDQDMEHCVFWGNVASALVGKEDAAIEDKYDIVFDTCREVFGNDFTPVDSSKNLGPLETMHQRLKGNMKVIFLIKDVRAYTVSQLASAKRKKRGYRYRSAAYHFLRWYRANRAFKDQLERQNISYFQIGYEELCLLPTQTIEKICEFLGESYEPSMLSLSNSGNHVIRGNRMRSQAGKRNGIMYDHRWFCRNDLNLWTVLFPRIMKFNDVEVYRNGTVSNWGK